MSKKQKNREELFQGNAWSVMAKMCVPSVVSILIMVIYNMADIYFVGKLDDPMMVAGLHVASPIFNVIAALGTLVGGGAAAALGNALGRKETDTVKAISSFGFWSAGILGVVYAVVMLIAMDPILIFAGAKEGAFPYACEYLRIISICAPILLIPGAMGNMIRSEGSAKQSMLGHLIGTVTNIILDPIFILALGWGVAGAAAATVLANACSLGYYVWYLTKKTENLTLAPKYFSLKDGIPLRVLSLGLPTAANTIINSISGVLANHVLAEHGELVIAAMSVTGKATMVVSMLQMGITMGIAPVLAYHYGAKDHRKLKEYVLYCGGVTVAMGSLLTVLCWLAGPSLVRIFLKDPEVVTMGTTFVRYSLIAGPVTGLMQLSTSFMQSTEKPLWALIMSTTRDGLVYLPLMYLLDHTFGLMGYVFARPVTTLLTACAGVILISLRYRSILRGQNSCVNQTASGIE